MIAPHRIAELEGLPERYAPRRHIADGGMASVWCAQDLRLGRSVAIKVLSARFAGDPDACRRFDREAHAAARLCSHPNVVTVFDVGSAGGRPFMVMEFLAGGTVADAIRVEAVTREAALRWVRGAAEALDHAHAHGVVHRDVKPANLLLDCERNVHIGDFGIALLSADETLRRSDLLGTAAYLAPEQALGSPGSPASDRYALGVVAYELLTGRRPFNGSDPVTQARQHLEQSPPRPSRVTLGLPPAVDAVLLRALAKSAADRWPSAVSLVEGLERALEAPAPDVLGQTTELPVVIAPAAQAAKPARPRRLLSVSFTRREASTASAA